MDIKELLSGDLGNQIINGIGKQVGTSEKETSSVLNAAAPALLGMLHKNASSEQGAQGILGALNKHDGSILDNISGFLGNNDSSDGTGILGNILGSNKGSFEAAVSKETGVSTAKVGGIIALFAPILMGFIGKSNKSNSSGGIGGMLGGMLGNSGSSSILSSILSGGGSGSVLGDVVSGALGGGSKKSSGGLGGILGGMFGKK